jgi:peptidoglycan/xylan/chitin deacetylase (PgdA/CDA1 family)
MKNIFLRFKVFVFLFLMFFLSADAIAKTATKKIFLFITIDVEAGSYKGKPNTLSDRIYGYIDGEYWGVPKMMELCKKYNVSATFFVDVYEYKYYGENAFKKIVTEIKENGFDVQLHAHPRWHYENNKDKMWQYSLEQQTEIIREGKKLIYGWTGVAPIAFRAGAFAADENTLKALEMNEIFFDSSLAFNYPSSRLSLLVPQININNMSNIGKVIEIPVTVFKEIKIGKYTRTRLFDIEANTLRELKYIVEQAKINHLPALVLMIHSHSFVKWNKERTRHWGDPHELKRFEEFLKYVGSDKDIVPITFSEFNALIQKGYKLEGNDYIPHTGFFMTYLRSLERIGEGMENQLFALTPPVFLIFLVIAYWYFLKRKKRA